MTGMLELVRGDGSQGHALTREPQLWPQKPLPEVALDGGFEEGEYGCQAWSWGWI